ncbi:MAG: dihydrolipoyl dehydrogenase [Tepidanaerobacteraceae bacterium]|jgi:dihydrolipoamide dehydrogenase|nr:dihydrolipoyl dehydrogenase [Tepidanaerobacteraceae bacterium]
MGYDYDVAVIGGGPGGYVAAIKASRLGAKTAVVEEQALGGTCLNRGCIPTKVYAHAAVLINEIENAKDFGIDAEYRLGIDRLRKKKENVVERLKNGVSFLMKAHNIDVIRGKASFIDEKTAEADGRRFTADKFIIATGSKTFVPPIPGADLPQVMTSERALEMEKTPESLVIIGAGVIGLEFACIYSALGSRVRIIEMLPELLPMLDGDIAGILKRSLERKGVELYLDSRVEKIEEGLKVVFSSGGKVMEADCDQVLVAAGRVANINGVEALRLNIDKKGIKVDDFMKTNIDNIYAVGDVTGGIQLAHAASYQGVIAAMNALGQRKPADLKSVPSCIYTEPEVALVGMSEKQARMKYGDIKVGTYPYSASGRALTTGDDTGLVKVIAEPKYKQILGMQIIGRCATEMIHEGALSIKNEFTLEEITETIHAHPTFSESIKDACEKITG